MSIQLRRGAYADFDPQKMKPAEVAVVQEDDPTSHDGKAVYVAISPGDVKRMAVLDELQDEVYNQIDTAISTATQAAVATATQAAAESASEAAASAAEAAASAQTLVVDDTLSVKGRAADAKETGSRLADLKGELTDLTDIGSEVISLFSVSDMTEKKAFYNTTYNRIAYTNNSLQRFDVFSVDAGDVVEIRGYGNNTEAGAFAMVGNADIVSTGATYCGLLQVIAPDSSSPSFHTVTATIEQAGYLYVNGTLSTAGTVKKTKSVTLIKTDKTLTSTVLPANSASVGEAIHGIGKAIEAIHGKGVYISNGNYYHFVRDGGTNIIRTFLRRGINNLFQWNQVLLGEVDTEGIHAETSYTGFGTDIVGPISIWNGTLWPGRYGTWTGGNHGISVGGIEYPTAEQLSFKCLVNGVEVSEDGLYFGDVRFIAENKLYFPQSITGADLSTATPAIIEHRSYFMSGGKMNVKIRLEFVEDVRVAHYYGMQAVDKMFDMVFCVNNDFYATISSISEVTHLSEQEHKIIFERTDNGLHMDMSLDELGLGTYKLNDASVGYVSFPAHGAGGTPKTYYDLISKSQNPSILSGANLFWEGTYDMYIS